MVKRLYIALSFNPDIQIDKETAATSSDTG